MSVANLEGAGKTFRFEFKSLAIPEDSLQPIRRDIYHSAGPGYHVFRNFLSPEIAAHMQRFWSELELTHVHQLLPDDWANGLFKGCPDYYYGTQQGDHRGYLNFFWNHPADEVSYAVAMQVQWLRNRVMGKAPQADIFPLHGRAVSYRAVISMRGEVVTRPHRDFDGREWIQDPSRLQATLYLSTPGIDYTGDGFILETNQGGSVRFGHEVAVASGDLILWRYCNQHSVLNVESSGAQCGFIRMLFPIEQTPHRSPPAPILVDNPPANEPPPAPFPVDNPSANEPASAPIAADPPSAQQPSRHLSRQELLHWLKGTPLGQHVLVPLWHRLRGR
jgi:hypothetical protein